MAVSQGAVVTRPLAPRSVEEAGLSVDLVTQLALKTLHFAGELPGTELAARLGLPFPAIEPGLATLKNQRHCEIVGGSLVGAPGYRYRITDAGRVRAMLFLEGNQYVGVAPVPLDQYRRYMAEFSDRTTDHITREQVRAAFAHLVVSERILDQIGPAVNARHSMFVYGPAGNGKTVISQAIRHLMRGDIAIPQAIEIEGAIIRVFNPVNHEPLEDPRPSDALDVGARPDGRWVRCRRPLVTVGGELTLEALDLNYSAPLGFYRAPVQVLANGGVLVVDDFGRQRCRPQDLLNRWIVPLESRVDHLTLQSGQKFEMPFSCFVVFATNLEPAELVDEAFLRRIQYKVYAENPTEESFTRIFENYCRDKGLACDRSLVEGLLATQYRAGGLALRCCHPRDLIEHALALAEYLEEPRRLTGDLLLAACGSYFVNGVPSTRA